MARKIFCVALLMSALGCAPGRQMAVFHRMDFNRLPPVFLKAPLSHHQILSPYGKRRGSFHTGIDVRPVRGQPLNVFSAGTGRVVRVERQRGYGNLVEIVHEKGFATKYAHLKRSVVKPGNWVQAGDLIGVMGKTGRATAIHLHFEIIDPTGRFIDPAPLFK